MHVDGGGSPPPSCSPRAVASLSDVDILYQPVVRLTTHRVVGHEALVRCHSGVPPGERLSRGETGSALAQLDRRCAFAALQEYCTMVDQSSLLFLNLHASSLMRVARFLPHWLPRMLGQSPVRVVFEVSEKSPWLRSPELAQTVQHVRACNGLIALGDFGAGNSGLDTYLELAPEIIKLDRTLFSHADKDHRRQSVLHAIVQLAHGAGVMVIAQGVETFSQLAFLKDLGIDYAQGFYVGKPQRPPLYWEQEGRL